MILVFSGGAGIFFGASLCQPSGSAWASSPALKVVTRVMLLALCIVVPSPFNSRVRVMAYSGSNVVVASRLPVS